MLGEGLLSPMAEPRRGVRRFMPLRGGDDELGQAATCCGFLVGFCVVLFSMLISSLGPNEYGLYRNFLTGSIGYGVERGGIYFTGPFKGFITFPACQTTLQWSASPDAERRPIMTRTGADPNDPDSGGQPISISCAVQIHFDKNRLRDTYFAFGSYEAARQRYLLLAGNVVSNTAQEFVPQDFWSRRDVIAEKMRSKINHTLFTQGFAIADRFEIMKVDFADKFESSITAIQVAEQSKVVNEYEQQVQTVVQQIEVMKSENNAIIANISAGADARSKEIRAGAKRDAFALKQGMKAQKYGELKRRLGFSTADLQEFFKIQVLQGQNKGNKVVVGLPSVGSAAPPKQEL